MHKLIIISGPSCAGKTPLFKAFGKMHPRAAGKMKKLVLYNSRSARPGEKEGTDYFFRQRKVISGMKKRPGFVVMNVRGDLQGLDTASLLKTLRRSSVIFEGNPFVGDKLLSLPALKNVPKISAFLSPLTAKEVLSLKRKAGRSGVDRHIERMMKRKLIERARIQGRELNASALRDIGRRAKSAAPEMRKAWRYDLVMPNHDGEDSPNWRRAPLPSGDALKAVRAFAGMLKGRRPTISEKWPRGFF